MNGIMSFMEKYFLPIAGKIGTQKHLIALRDAFISTLPVTMAGAIAVLLNAFLRDFPSEFGWHGFVDFMQPVIGVNGFVWTGSLAVMAVIFAVTLGYNLAKAYEVEPLPGAIVSLAAFLMSLTQTATTKLNMPVDSLSQEAMDVILAAGGSFTTVVTDTGETLLQLSSGAWGYFDFNHLGGAGLFTALIFGMISTIIFSKLVLKKIVIKMPDAVPPAVAKAFAAIIPAMAALFTVGIINQLFMHFTGDAVVNWISSTIQAPLMDLSQGFGAIMIVVFLVHVLWFFGLHGTNIMFPILQSLYGVAMVQNTSAFEQGLPIPYNWVAGSFDAFVWPGGAGLTLVFIICTILLSRRADAKAVGKLALVPGVFNINEPIMFGMPIVLNPVYMIPFVLAPMLTAAISYGATIWGLVNPVVINVIWVMPAGISGFLATGGDWRAIILTLVNLLVAFVVWAPFVLAANRMEEGE